jgi:hypothetical protein
MTEKPNPMPLQMTAMISLPCHCTKTCFALLLACAGSLCCIGNIAQAGSRNSHAIDAALEAGQIVAPGPVAQALEVVDTVRDAAATVGGATTAISVIGSSGPTILGNLASAGGPVTAGALSGFGVAGLQSKYLYSDCKDADACDAAAIAGYAGAGAGVAGAAALGASYGVGASGLAAIGGFVGGGMVAGATSLIALPAVGAVVIGAGVYGIVLLLND